MAVTELISRIQMQELINVRIAGRGGQGIIKLGLILAEACVLEGKNVVQVQSYGPEARGGACRTDVITGDGEIDYPGITQIDVLLVLDQEAYDKFSPMLVESSTVIYDSELVVAREGIGIAFSRMAEEEFNNRIFVNMIALGTLVAITGMVRPETVIGVLRRRLRKFKEENVKAFLMGFEEGEKYTGSETGSLRNTGIKLPVMLKSD